MPRVTLTETKRWGKLRLVVDPASPVKLRGRYLASPENSRRCQTMKWRLYRVVDLASPVKLQGTYLASPEHSRWYQRFLFWEMPHLGLRSRFVVKSSSGI